jgi:hypothetical protein
VQSFVTGRSHFTPSPLSPHPVAVAGAQCRPSGGRRGQGPTVAARRRGFELVTAAVGFAGFLYPADNPAPSLAQVYAKDPDLAGARPPFLRTMNAFSPPSPPDCPSSDHHRD